MYRVEIISLPKLRVAAIQHRGDYQLTSKAFERLMTVAATTGLLRPNTRTIGSITTIQSPCRRTS